MTTGIKDTGNEKLEFVAKTEFVLQECFVYLIGWIDWILVS